MSTVTWEQRCSYDDLSLCIPNFRQKLESTLAQLNTEHCEIVKELVMQRLKNEEMEGELVRYKLL